MVPRDLPSRGLADLRTLGGRDARRVPTHKAYLRISFLELERARHGQEIRTARQRLEFMLARCRQIDVEVAGILAAVGVAADTARAPGAAGSRRPSPSRRHGFRFSY